MGTVSPDHMTVLAYLRVYNVQNHVRTDKNASAAGYSGQIMPPNLFLSFVCRHRREHVLLPFQVVVLFCFFEPV